MRVFAMILPVVLAGCTATIPPVEVTRFHLGQPIPAGNVSIVPVAGGDSQALEFRTYAAAVARELARLGYTEATTAQTPLIAEVEFSRGTRTDFERRSPVTIGIGGGSYGGGLGVGIGTSFGVGGNKSRETVITRLSVRMKTRLDGKPVWEGRAETQAPANAPSAQPGLAADKLAAALFKDFPGRSGETITVP
jgi:Domain of unknown function (DUF4136)